MRQTILIAAGNVQMKAELDDSSTVKAAFDALPLNEVPGGADVRLEKS